MIAVINYDRHSSESLKTFFNSIDILDKFNFTDSEDEISSAEKIILPDTSNVKLTLRWMQFHNFYNLFRMINKPILGLAAGAAMMCDSIVDIQGLCLRFFPIRADLLKESNNKTIHSEINISPGTILLNGITGDDISHLENKCKIEINNFTSSTVKSGDKTYSASMENSDYYGVSFDIAKSGIGGEKILKNFISI